MDGTLRPAWKVSAGPTLVATATVAAIAMGVLAASGGWIAIGVTVGVVLLASVTALSGRFRIREMVLWLLVIVAVGNFATVLYEPTHLLAQPLWLKVVKDIPVALAIAVFALAPAEWSSEERRRSVRTLAWILGGWVLVMAANAVLLESPLSGFLVSLRYYVVYPALAIVIARAGMRLPEVNRLLKLLVVLGALQGVVALAEFFGFLGQTFYSNYVQFGGGSFPRAIGTLGSPNNLAIFLGLPLCALFASIEGGSGEGRRTARWSMYPRGRAFVLLVLVLLGFALAFSKSAAVAAGIALAAQSRHIRRRYRIVLITVLTFALALLAIQGRAGTETSARARIDATASAYERWTEDAGTFFFGTGFGGQVAVEGTDIVQEEVTDSMPLTLALEGGLLGLGAFALLVVAGIRLALGGRRSRRRTALYGALFGYIVFFLVLSPALVNFRLFPAALVFWVAIGLAGLLREPDPATTRASNQPAVAMSSRK